MTIWLLAIILLACLAAIGYQQGAIRVSISFFGIIIAALLAAPLAKLIKPALGGLGVVNPVLLWLLPPLIVFIIVLSVVKIIGLAVHKKVDVYYKYKAGDLRLALWERLNARLGACLGLLNGLAYLVLIAWVTFAFSYWTTQMSSGDTDPKIVKLFNRMGQDLQSTGLARAARAIDGMPEVYYDAADLAGLLYQNSLLEARLSRYPAFLSLAEKPEFQAIAQDKTFSEARLRRAPIREVLENANVSAIVKNPDTLKLIWGIVAPDLKDLQAFLVSGTSERYGSEKILGRWFFDVNATIVAYRKDKPRIQASEMLKFKRWMAGAFAKTMMVCAPDHVVFLKNVPQLKVPTGQTPGTETQNFEGTWKSAGSNYELSLGNGGERKAKLDGGRLNLSGEGNLTLVFDAED